MRLRPLICSFVGIGCRSSISNLLLGKVTLRTNMFTTCGTSVRAMYMVGINVARHSGQPVFPGCLIFIDRHALTPTQVS